MSADWQIAQVNIALPREPLDSQALAGFVANLEPVNAIADSAPGFVWRLADDSGDATSIRAFDDDRLIINMSVWESVEALWRFVYDRGHLDVMRRRREWMTRLAEAHQALWWIPAGQIPSVDEAKRRIDHLRARGPTHYAFTFRHRYEAPDSGSEEPMLDSREPCAAP